MRSRRLNAPGALVIGAMLIVLLGSVTLWLSREPAEPVYAGKTLSRWLENHTASSSANPPYGSPGWHKANEALKAIGSNGVPTLLRMISAKNLPAPVLKALEFARRKQSLIQISYRYAQARNDEAEYAFRVLGTNAAGAVPALIQLYERPVTQYSQNCVALALGSIGRPAKAALPALLKNFTHANGDVRFYAVSAAYHIGGDPDVLIPAFKSVLKDPNKSVAWNAAVGLSGFGSRARSAVPELLGVAGNPAIREQIEESLWYIAPETISDPLVVGDATAMITNGVTAETVEVAFKRERRAFVKAGRAVPCLTQFWDSEPRYPLTLYRTRDKTNSQLLGHFEVVGVAPPPTNANVGLLCVIADQRIFLCARDYTNKKFLPVRRIEPGE